MKTIETIMNRLNCSEVYAQYFFDCYGDDQEAINKEVARQAHKRKTTKAITEYKIEGATV